MKIIKAADLREGRWRNGFGVSWDIASDPPDDSEFGWRLAIARIDSDVPFSHYANVDRIFTLIEGRGLDLDFEGLRTLAFDRLFVPHPYPCDVATFCRLSAGPCRALNLFMRRGQWSATVEITSGTAAIAHNGPILVHALDGPLTANGIRLEQGDTLLADGQVEIAGQSTQAYVARLSPAAVGGGLQSR